MPIQYELLFYGGIAVLSLTFIVAVVFACCYKVKAKRLNARLNAEYGEEKK